MNIKLTVKLEQEVIERAKEYAKSRRTSLSNLIENYLQKITNEEPKAGPITPLVKSLSGIISLPEDFDHKKEYAGFITEKYK